MTSQKNVCVGGYKSPDNSASWVSWSLGHHYELTGILHIMRANIRKWQLAMLVCTAAGHVTSGFDCGKINTAAQFRDKLVR